MSFRRARRPFLAPRSPEPSLWLREKSKIGVKPFNLQGFTQEVDVSALHREEASRRSVVTSEVDHRTTVNGVCSISTGDICRALPGSAGLCRAKKPLSSGTAGLPGKIEKNTHSHVRGRSVHTRSKQIYTRGYVYFHFERQMCICPCQSIFLARQRRQVLVRGG
jgi:hypothetical protein